MSSYEYGWQCTGSILYTIIEYVKVKCNNKNWLSFDFALISNSCDIRELNLSLSNPLAAQTPQEKLNDEVRHHRFLWRPTASLRRPRCINSKKYYLKKMIPIRMSMSSQGQLWLSFIQVSPKSHSETPGPWSLLTTQFFIYTWGFSFWDVLKRLLWKTLFDKQHWTWPKFTKLKQMVTGAGQSRPQKPCAPCLSIDW